MHTAYALFHLSVLLLLFSCAFSKLFTIDYQNNCYSKDGTCYRYFSGSIHYSRVLPQYWEDRLTKMQAAGLTVIQTYVPWNFHEQQPGVFDFSGNANLTAFLDIVESLGLLAVMRTGPYIDASWDMGGFPWWLLKLYPDIKLRTFDPNYTKHVEIWFDQLLSTLKPYLYENNGPIIAFQVENEYGSYYACDRNYTAWLRDLMRKNLGNNTVLFTDDGNADYYLKCGVIPNVYPTIDFGVSSEKEVNDSFIVQRKYAPSGPLINTEFYTGWDDYWGVPHATGNTTAITNTMTYMWNAGASFNFYMFEGGTTFGYWVGAVGSETTQFQTVTTSYDYDAPISEAGDPTPKYMAIRETIQKLTNKSNPHPVPPATKKMTYGNVTAKRLGHVLDLLDYITNSSLIKKSKYPLTMEQINHPYGFVLYQTTLANAGSNLSIPGVHDRAYVLQNGNSLLDVLQRPISVNASIITGSFVQGDTVQILIENQGRICYGTYMNDSKGLVKNVTLDGKILTDWTIYPIQVELLFKESKQRLKKLIAESWFKSKMGLMPVVEGLPSVYFTQFNISDVQDTYLDPTNWTKGQVWINRFNLGRYWPAQKPQIRLYVPKYLLSKNNVLLMLELETAGNCDDNHQCNVTFVDKPLFSLSSTGEHAIHPSKFKDMAQHRVS